MVNFPKCGKENPDDALFCGYCKAELEEKKKPEPAKKIEEKKKKRVSKEVIIVLVVVVAIAIIILISLFAFLFNVIPDIFREIAGEHYHLQFGENITLDNTLDIRPYHKEFENETGGVKTLLVKVEYWNLGDTDFYIEYGDLFTLKYRGKSEYGVSDAVFKWYWFNESSKSMLPGERRVMNVEFTVPENLGYDECELYLSKKMEYTSGERYRVTWALS